MTQDFQRPFTPNACLRQTSLINILVVLLNVSLKDIIPCLDCLSTDLFLIAFPIMVFSHT